LGTCGTSAPRLPTHHSPNHVLRPLSLAGYAGGDSMTPNRARMNAVQPASDVRRFDQVRASDQSISMPLGEFSLDGARQGLRGQRLVENGQPTIALWQLLVSQRCYKDHRYVVLEERIGDWKNHLPV